MEVQMIDRDKTYLITGGAGFLGTELISRLQKERFLGMKVS